MSWEIFNIVGIVAFAVSGAIVAMEENYDILGIYILGLVTAFGGGAIRNLLFHIPVSSNQGTLFVVAVAAMTVVFFMPKLWFRFIKQWTFFDAVGLAAFAIQGALYAYKLEHSLGAIIVAAVLTGSGGGMIRDVLAGRKPLIFRDEIYAIWATIGGLMIGLGLEQKPLYLYSLFSLIVLLRLLSVYFHWKLPRKRNVAD